ncbi:shikimate dehydrogenase (NADP(+)) [Agaricicola taiwanensis]|uniref:Shikimate dehydrogenase (NADP(+)) n=1 Tax=Agaricicola taiwanensis TaxID=591372 RepID=A0A8J2VEI0_9RHOB|nr:shikimate dehydrogenase [Agaricicola taiwanensis]GGE28842.1 shikimate dehydrogenase (NADP(+)) [Agaricicola taiwanensis]
MTRRVCIIGHPVAHSRSPMLHGHWLKTYGIEGEYGREDVAPEDFPDFLRDLEANGYVGANVTVPHKESALATVDVADATARAVGAVNTVWIDGGKLHGSNTDVHGFMANLDANAPGWDNTRDKAVILGAGGASRAAAYGLAQRGFGSIVLVNRTLDRAEKLVADLGGHPLQAAAWSDLDDHLKEAGLLVNATSLGMAGKAGLAVDLDALPQTCVVTDLVYVPLETSLLAEARARGNRVVDGLGMLLHQAVPGFEIWFGRRPEVTGDLRNLIVADLTAAR